MSYLTYISYRKIGTRNNNKRVWLQGQCLEDAGFSIGVSFSIEIIENRILLSITDTGQLIVSRKKKSKGDLQPVVDINNQALTEFFGQFERAKISFYFDGRIEITHHPLDLKVQERLFKIQEAIRHRIVSIGSNAHGGGIMSSAIDDGLTSSGFKGQMVFAIEKEQKYLESSMRNSPVWLGNSLAIESKMEEVELSVLSSVLLYEAGLPCTGASVAGRAKKKLSFAEQHESSGRLFYSFLSHIQQVNPAIVLLENVKQYMNTMSFHVILDVLDEWGYQTQDAARVLNGRDFGAIENRERMFLICPTKGLEFDWQWLESQQSLSYESLVDLLDDISPDSDLWSEMKGLKQKQLNDQANGNSFKMQIVDERCRSTPVIGRGYSKIRSTEPKLVHPTNDELLRQFTTSEHARLKTIPEHLISGNYKTTGHEILGQSVIYDLVKAIGYAIGQALQSYGANWSLNHISQS